MTLSSFTNYTLGRFSPVACFHIPADEGRIKIFVYYKHDESSIASHTPLRWALRNALVQ